MEHPEDYKLRKRYEADRASGIATGSMAQWMNDTAFKGLTTKLEAHRERIISQVEEERRKEPHTYGDFIREIAKANSDIAKYKDVPENLQNSYRVKLNKQFDDLVDRGYFSESSRGDWVNKELSNYMWSEEYQTARDNVREARIKLLLDITHIPYIRTERGICFLTGLVLCLDACWNYVYKRCEEVPTVEYSAKAKEAYIQYMKEHEKADTECAKGLDRSLFL